MYVWVVLSTDRYCQSYFFFFTKSYDAMDKKAVSSCTKKLVSQYNFYIKCPHLKVPHNTIITITVDVVPLLFWQGSYGILKNPAELYSDMPVAKMEPEMI